MSKIIQEVIKMQSEIESENAQRLSQCISTSNGLYTILSSIELVLMNEIYNFFEAKPNIQKILINSLRSLMMIRWTCKQQISLLPNLHIPQSNPQTQ